MSVGLHGNLGDFGIAEVFQLIGQQRKTGVLELSREDESVQFLFDRGAVVSAAPVGARPHAALGEMLVRCGQLTRDRVDELYQECDAGAQVLPRLAVAREWISQAEISEIEDLLTRETFFSVLRWADGSFRFGAREVEHPRRFGDLLGAEQILMDGLRMMDEWQSFSELVPSEDLVFRRSGGFEAFLGRQQEAAGPQQEQAERVFALVDGRLAVRRIIDLSRLGTFDATRSLAALTAAGAIEPVAGTGAPRRRAAPRSPAFSRAQLRGWIGGLLPLSLLLLVAFASMNRIQPAASEGFAIRRDALATARAAYAARRVRHALEDHRMTAGSYPRDLAELRALPEDALASPGGATYYYAPRDAGAVLLAPER
ncbi:MAG TPA: DUF4388 domain-containing protein [Myxococcota bacterium]